ncbi:hypothetical protein TI04_06075 [Achromatium sp. WMS2]|nr:hypothetical protein TI04_06075 [Achromatium sp. WMS2]
MANSNFDKIFSYHTLGRWILGLALLIGLVVLVEYQIGWLVLLVPWIHLSVTQLAVLLFFTGASYVLRAVRFYDYSHKILGGAFLATLRLTLFHNLLNNFLPMRLGELAYPMLMKRYFAQDYLASSVTLLWTRVLDLHFLGLPALIFLYVVQQFSLWLLLIPVWISLVPIAYWGRGYIYTWVKQYDSYIMSLLAKILQNIPDQAYQFYRIWLWTALTWTCKLLAFSFMVMHFSGLDLGRAVLGTLGAELSTVLPIHGIAGAGSYELAMSVILVPLGIDLTTILQAAVNLHLYLLGTSLLFAAIGWLLPYPKVNHNES